MSLYQSPLETVTVSGVEYQIETDFRFWIKFQGVLLSADPVEKKSEQISEMMAKSGLPVTKEALDAMLKFYAGASTENASSGKSNGQSFDFEKDSEYIFSAFSAAYGIDLSTEQLHWWRFKALFKSLPEDCQMCKIMMYRTVDLKKVPKEQRQFYRDMKARYALSGGTANTYRTEQEMKDYVKKRFEEAKGRMSALRSGKQPSAD